MSKSTRECMLTALERGIVIPAFNIPYLPVMEPVVRALHDTDTFGLIQGPAPSGRSSRPRA